MPASELRMCCAAPDTALHHLARAARPPLSEIGMNLICGIMAKVARKRKTIWARVGSRWPEIGSRTRDLRRLSRLLKG